MHRALFIAVGAALFVVPAQPQAAQPAYKAPVNAYGQPDLGSYWTNASLTPESRPAALGDRLAYTPAEVAKLEQAVVVEQKQGNEHTDPHAPAPSVGGETPPPGTRPEYVAAGGKVGFYNIGWLDPGSVVMRVHGQPRTSLITTTDGQAPVYKAGATPYVVTRVPGSLGSFDNPEQRSLGERCIMGFGRNAGPPMLANGFYNNDYEFVQTRDTVAIMVEMVHDVRVVRLNAAHRTDGLRPWMGDSVGHWEGQTLVVETTNIPQAQAYHGAWKALTVIERFTRVAGDRLLYQFTVSDPTVWDKPWGGEYEFSPLKGILYEYACHEGNYALEDMLAGARAEDAAEAAKAKLTPASAAFSH